MDDKQKTEAYIKTYGYDILARIKKETDRVQELLQLSREQYPPVDETSTTKKEENEI